MAGPCDAPSAAEACGRPVQGESNIRAKWNGSQNLGVERNEAEVSVWSATY